MKTLLIALIFLFYSCSEGLRPVPITIIGINLYNRSLAKGYCQYDLNTGYILVDSIGKFQVGDTLKFTK